MLSHMFYGVITKWLSKVHVSVNTNIIQRVVSAVCENWAIKLGFNVFNLITFISIVRFCINHSQDASGCHLCNIISTYKKSKLSTKIYDNILIVACIYTVFVYWCVHLRGFNVMHEWLMFLNLVNISWLHIHTYVLAIINVII